MVAGWKFVSFLKAPVSDPPLSQFNRTFQKTSWPPLHKIPVLPRHCHEVCSNCSHISLVHVDLVTSNAMITMISDLENYFLGIIIG
jgi:hypothetical protein